MTEFESLLRELAKVDRDITAHFDAHPETRGTPLEGLSAEVRAEWTNLIQRKYLALDAVAAMAVKKYANEQL